MGQRPTPTANTNGDRVVNVKAGASSYGAIQTTLSTTDTSSLLHRTARADVSVGVLHPSDPGATKTTGPILPASTTSG